MRTCSDDLAIKFRSVKGSSLLSAFYVAHGTPRFDSMTLQSELAQLHNLGQPDYL